jgi:hypothetical protein
MFKRFLLSALLTLASVQANASYFITAYKQGTINYEVPTRLMLAGNGDDLGLLFQEVAKGKAQKYSELNPGEQIVFITINEKELDNANALARWGFNIVEDERGTLDGKKFIKEAIRFKKILSLDIFSHSSAQFGIHLDGKAHRLTLNTKGLEAIKGNFMKDAYAYLHGCNSGFNLAPFLSEVWGIPVAGSMTSTNFQKLHSDGNFYLNETQYAPNSNWSKSNNLSFNKETQCSGGTCLRLKPDNTPYVGYWGAYRGGGLPFYKFFCIKNSKEDCMRVMAKTMLTHVGTVNLKKDSSLAKYKEALFDFLCPISATKDIRQECVAKLEEALVTKDYTYNPFSRPQVECNFKSCEAAIECDKIFMTGIPKPGTCELKNLAVTPATTLVREYLAYLEGFKSLAK